MADRSDIFDRLKQDHDKHREILAKLVDTHGESAERKALLEQFTIEAKGHAAAEEQALYSTVMRKPPTTEEARHSVAEHHDIEESLNDLAATDMASDEWLAKAKELKHTYEHHIDEEEEEMFPLFDKELTKDDEVYMRQVFERRKQAEAGKAEVTPEKKEDAKE